MTNSLTFTGLRSLFSFEWWRYSFVFLLLQIVYKKLSEFFSPCYRQLNSLSSCQSENSPSSSGAQNIQISNRYPSKKFNSHHKVQKTFQVQDYHIRTSKKSQLINTFFPPGNCTSSSIYGIEKFVREVIKGEHVEWIVTQSFEE